MSHYCCHCLKRGECCMINYLTLDLNMTERGLLKSDRLFDGKCKCKEQVVPEEGTWSWGVRIEVRLYGSISEIYNEEEIVWYP